jgi:hypothetical protein
MKREQVTFVMSQRLIELLLNTKHQISKHLVDMVKCRDASAISYIDFGEKNDSVSFIYSNKLYEIQDEFNDKWNEKVWSNKRSDIKIGKFIKMMFDDYYPINQPKEGDKPKIPNDIENFVNIYKAEREKDNIYEKFELVKGKDIIKWYCFENYSKFATEYTTLGKSCMRYKESSKFLELYSKNTNCISLLILKDNEGKLKGRAIVWDLTYPENRIFMDRIYTVNDYDIQIFKKFAEQNGWIYKDRQVYGWHNDIYDPRYNTLNSYESFIMKVSLINKPGKYYPYLDTLSVYNVENNILSNEGKLLKKPGHLHLADYQGGYIDEADYRSMVYSNIYNCEIPEEEAIFSEIDNTWIYKNDSVYVYNTGGKLAYRNSELIVQSKLIYKRKYFLKSECVYSEYLKTYIFKDSLKEAYLEENKQNCVIIHYKLINKFFKYNDNGDLIKIPNIDIHDPNTYNKKILNKLKSSIIMDSNGKCRLKESELVADVDFYEEDNPNENEEIYNLYQDVNLYPGLRSNNIPNRSHNDRPRRYRPDNSNGFRLLTDESNNNLVVEDIPQVRAEEPQRVQPYTTRITQEQIIDNNWLDMFNNHIGNIIVTNTPQAVNNVEQEINNITRFYYSPTNIPSIISINPASVQRIQNESDQVIRTDEPDNLDDRL